MKLKGSLKYIMHDIWYDAINNMEEFASIKGRIARDAISYSYMIVQWASKTRTMCSVTFSASCDELTFMKLNESIKSLSVLVWMIATYLFLNVTLSSHASSTLAKG